jgi:hypothetical protein
MPDGMISPHEPAPIRLNPGPRAATPPGLGQVAPYEPGPELPDARSGPRCITCGHFLSTHKRPTSLDGCDLCDCARFVEPQSPHQYGFESVRVMRLQPGDVIVVEVDYPVSQADQDAFTRRLERTFPGHTGFVIDNGARLSVARPDADLGSVKPNPETTKDGDQS